MMEAQEGPGAPRPARQDERELLSRCRDGDSAAFGILVARYRDRAYGLALRLTRSAPDAEEVAQDAFVGAWRAIRTFRGDSAFGTWLYRIVWRKALDRAERIRNRSRREVAVDDPARVESDSGAWGAAGGGVATGPGGGADSLGAQAATEAATRLERLIQALPAAARAAVTLFYYEDRSVADVAATLGLPEGTVKTHLRRARAALREGWLRETEGEPDHALR